MESKLNCDEIISSFDQALKLMQEGLLKKHIDKWVNEIAPDFIEKLQKLLHDDQFNVGEKLKLQNTVALLHGIHNQMNLLIKSGAGIAGSESTKVCWNEIERAFDSRIMTGAISNLGHIDVLEFLKDAQIEFERQIKLALIRHNSLKVYAIFAAKFFIMKQDKEIIEKKYFNTKAKAIYKTTILSEWFINNIQDSILTDIEEFEESDSGWSLHSILNLTLYINKLNPLRGSSYIPLPRSIESKHACINVDNDDNECFRWAVLSALFPPNSNPQAKKKYEVYKDEIEFGNIKFPVRPKDIAKFEKLNPNISINLYMLEKCKGKFVVVPCHLTASKKPTISIYSF